MWETVVILGILVVVGYWVLHPLMRPKRIEDLLPHGEEDRSKVLVQRKEEVYAAIKDMDFDFEMGKISEKDYQELKSQYKARALEILKELDGAESEDGLDRAIEREVQQLRGKKRPKKKKKGGKGAGKQINFCPQCGSKIAPNDNFCPGCRREL